MATCSALPSHPSIKRRARFTAARASRRACQLHKDQEHVLGVPDAAFFFFLLFFFSSARVFCCMLVICSGTSGNVKAGGRWGGLSGRPLSA